MPELASDVVIVGSGPTGAAAALALVGQNASVTMLESGTSMPGGFVLQADGRNLIRRTRPAANQEPYVSTLDSRTHWYHELSPGGLTNQWTCAVPRYDPLDFDDGARVHEKYRWPVSYNDLEPYYARMEMVMGVTGPATAVAAMPAAKTRHTSRLPSAWSNVARIAAVKGRAMVTMPMATGSGWGIKTGGTPFNSFSDVIAGLQNSGRLKVQLGAHALRLEHDDSGQVNRVIYFDRATNSQTSIACKAVVVAAGPVGSTKLLLNSTSSSFPSGLGNHNGLLGSYLHDHVHDMFSFDLNRPLPRLGHEGYFTRAPYAESEPMLAAGCVVGGRVSQLDRLLTLTPVPTRTFGVIIFGTMLPQESNCIRQSSLQDGFGMSQADIRLEYEDADKATTRQARDAFLEILSEAGLGPKLRWNLEEPIPGSSVHFGGTVRMHESPEYGLTDGWCRLQSVKNVMVADASVFTTCVEKNPTLTAMALANRGAERLALDLKAGNLGKVPGMKYRTLLGTDLEVSELGVGCARLGGLFYKATEADTISLLHSAFDKGITFYDTANMYAQGESERLLGKAFAANRSKVVIASKAGYMLPPQRKLMDRLKPIARPIVRRLRLSQKLSSQMVRGTLRQDFSPDTISSALQGSLARLGTDYLDLYMLHGVPGDHWDETMDRLELLKSQGLIRYYGISCATIDDARECLVRTKVSALQVNLSLLHQEAVSFLPEAKARSVGIVARQCYASGLLSRPSHLTDFRQQPPDRLPGVRSFEALAKAHGRRLPEIALKFVNQLPGVDVTLVGVRTADHLNDAIEFLDAPPLSDAEMSAMTALSMPRA